MLFFYLSRIFFLKNQIAYTIYNRFLSKFLKFLGKKFIFLFIAKFFSKKNKSRILYIINFCPKFLGLKEKNEFCL